MFGRGLLDRNMNTPLKLKLGTPVFLLFSPPLENHAKAKCIIFKVGSYSFLVAEEDTNYKYKVNIGPQVYRYYYLFLAKPRFTYKKVYILITSEIMLPKNNLNNQCGLLLYCYSHYFEELSYKV